LDARLERSSQRDVFEAFLRRHSELVGEEERLMKVVCHVLLCGSVLGCCGRVQAVQESEDVVLKVRERLANPPQSFLPDDPVKVRGVLMEVCEACVRRAWAGWRQAQLYVCWKRCCVEKEEVVAAARRRRVDSLHELRLQYENEVIGLDADRRRALGAVGDAVDKVCVVF
jgi:hypothetical protein